MNFVEELREMDRVMRAFNGCCEPLAPTVVYRNRPVVRQQTGEVLGDGHPDWPEDLQTYAERKAYQRGVADARRLDKLAQQATARPSLPAGPSGDTLADFRAGQWWHRELEMALKHGNPDQRQALAVLRNLLKTVEATVAAAQTP